MSSNQHTFFTSLVAGGIAGLTVDTILFPLDTLKTRQQASQGFWKVGGFRGIYKGISAAILGSVPTSALFFATYEFMKPLIAKCVQEWGDSLDSNNRNSNRNGSSGIFSSASVAAMAAASLGEATACIFRVPTEVVKQRLQTGVYDSLWTAIREILRSEGARGFFTGYSTTVAREVPFSFIQFPVYEKLKLEWSDYQQKPTTPLQGAACGSLAGSLAAAFTTPLDVVKTRLMLGTTVYARQRGLIETAKEIYLADGGGRLFSGVVPRTLWTTLGGFLFFGAYEQATALLQRREDQHQD